MAILSKKAARDVLEQILELYPNAKTELNYDTPFHLLTSVIMSAQTTDKQVNKISPKFNQHFKEPMDLALATIPEIEKYISSIGLYHNKAKNLQGMAQMLVADFHGQIPSNKDELLKLPGVGIKTANVVLAELYQIPAIAVDTHVERIAKAFNIVEPSATPAQVEQRLEAVLPKDEWIAAHHALIFFGRYQMTARSKNQDPYSYLPKKAAK